MTPLECLGLLVAVMAVGILIGLRVAAGSWKMLWDGLMILIFWRR